jgi:alkanesulfonate monooxygenase SsuD/methylene tetrahydromethanopterin reductase-like flavin-dependent oxidoreductase (luciferase family)
MTHPIQFGIVCGQRASFAELSDRIVTTERTGWDSFEVVDHFYGLFDVMEPTHEAYTMLAALAPLTNRVRLGVMVAGNTYRNPVLLLKQAMTVDEISGGRVTFGVGAGWTRREHEAYGWELYDPKTRVDRFEEALEMWDLLQSKERVTYFGKHYELIDAPFEPKSSQGRLPMLIGGTKPRMMRLVARYADIWDSTGTPEVAGAASRNLDKACLEVGRDPASIVRSISPALSFLESAQKFEEYFHAYRELGFTYFRIPWPRQPGQKEVFDEIMDLNLIPRLREG